VGGMGDGGEGSPAGLICIPFLLFLHILFFVRGTHTPRLAHSALLRAEDLLCCSSPAEGRELVPFVSGFSYFLYATYPYGMNGVSRDP
jgi:hypothetical protein